MQELALAGLRAVVERGARTGWMATPAGVMRYAVRGEWRSPPVGEQRSPLPERPRQLLLLHGLGDSLAGWAQVVHRLARTHEVHLLDLPGHGLSSRPPDWRLSTMVNSVHQYAQQLDPDALVVGHSLGGWIALKLALAGAVRRLALVNPGGARLDRERYESFRELVSARDRAGVNRYLEAAFHRAPFFFKLFPNELIELMHADVSQGFLSSVRDEDFLNEQEVQQLQIPTHLIWAERDRLLPEGSLDFFRRALPNARFTSLPRAGHLPHLEQPRALAAALVSR